MKKRTLYKLFAFSLLALLFTENSLGQEGTLTVKEDARVTQLMALKTRLQKENKLTDGFTIQLYYGDLNKANNVLKEYRNKHSKWPATIEYETPNYKVWAGNFQNRLEADRALLEIQSNFPSAFILRPGKNKKDSKDDDDGGQEKEE